MNETHGPAGSFRGLMVLVLALLTLLPPAQPGARGRSPDVLSTFSDGRAEVEVYLDPLPALNRSVSIALPWNAEVTGAGLTVEGLGRELAGELHATAPELAALRPTNLTLAGGALELDRGAWYWEQSGEELGRGCEIHGARIGDGLTLDHSCPPLSGSGGGIWSRRAELNVSETGGVSRTNESVCAHIDLPEATVRNPYSELRLTDGSGVEMPCFIHNTSFKNHFCVGADLLFALPSIQPWETSTLYIYYRNPAATPPSYDDQLFLAERFDDPFLPAGWSFSGAGWVRSGVGRGLRICGTATEEFWSGGAAESCIELGGDFVVEVTINVTAACGTGYLALATLSQDARNSLSFGVQYDSEVASLSPAKLVLLRTSYGSTELVASAEAGSPGVSHRLRGEYSSGSLSLSVDGSFLASTSLLLSRPRVVLSAGARAIGDTVDAVFDDLLAFRGYRTVGIAGPAPLCSIGRPEGVGYNSTASVTSPEIESERGLPYGLLRLQAETPQGTGCSLSVLDPSGPVLLEGLRDGDPVTVSPAEHPSIRLLLQLSTTSDDVTPRVRSWGLGTSWIAGLPPRGEWPEADGITPSAGGVELAFSMTNWTKQGTPALGMGTPSTFDDAGVSQPCVIETAGGFWMYYAGFDGTRWRVGLATSADGSSWVRSPDSPVLVQGAGWDSSSVAWPFVLYNGSGYQMWYAGSGDGGATFEIGYASSPDGIRWLRHGTGPVLGRGPPGSWNSRSVFAPRVIFNGSGYTMWFAGSNGTHTMVGLATSSDGVSWTLPASNPVLCPQSWFDRGAVPGTVLRRQGGGYVMWFGGSNATGGAVGLAESPDGVEWTVAGRVLSNGTGSAHDRALAACPAVLFDGLHTTLYSGYNGSAWRILCARADRCPAGSLLSAPVDIGFAPASCALSVNATVPPGTSLEVRVRFSHDGLSWTQWLGLGASSSIAPRRFLQWMALLSSSLPDASPVLNSFGGELEHHIAMGVVEVAVVELQPHQSLSSVSVTALASGPGSVRLLATGDAGASWTPLESGVGRELNGSVLLIKAILSGNYTTSPSLSALLCSYNFNSWASGLGLDVGLDGVAEWSEPGVLRGIAVSSNLSAALNTFLEAHRSEPGDHRSVPLGIYSATAGRVCLRGLEVEFSPRAVPNHPPEVRSAPPLRAIVRQLYQYIVLAADEDPRDRLSYSLEAGPEGMVISSLTGELSWVPSLDQVGYHPVCVAVSDGRSRVLQNYTLVCSVSPVNMPPRVTGAPPSAARVGYELYYDVVAEDPDGGPLSYSLAPGSPAGAGINGATGELSWVPGVNQTGVQWFEVLVSDAIDTVHRRFAVNVSMEGANAVPVVVSSPPPTARIGLPYCYTIAASDPDGDSLSYSLVSGPPGASVSVNGTLGWLPKPTDMGNATFVVRVSDGKGYALHSFTVRVLPENVAPVFGNYPLVLRIKAGTTWSFTPIATDADGDPLSFDLVSGPTGMSINSSTGSLSWRPGPSQTGRFQVVLSVTDGIAVEQLAFVIEVEGAAGGGGVPWLGIAGVVLFVAAAIAGAATYYFLKRSPAGSRGEEGPKDEGAEGEGEREAPEEPAIERYEAYEEKERTPDAERLVSPPEEAELREEKKAPQAAPAPAPARSPPSPSPTPPTPPSPTIPPHPAPSQSPSISTPSSPSRPPLSPSPPEQTFRHAPSVPPPPHEEAAPSPSPAPPAHTETEPEWDFLKSYTEELEKSILERERARKGDGEVEPKSVTQEGGREKGEGEKGSSSLDDVLRELEE